MSTEVVAPKIHPTTSTFDRRKKAKSLSTVPVYRMNSSGSASFNLDDEELVDGEHVLNTSESDPDNWPSTESLEIDLNW